MDPQKPDQIAELLIGAGIQSNPFPGLRPFSVEESHLFFGREGQSDEVLLKLAENRFTAILGASGSGKSSLMYCGLIPILHGGFMAQAGSDWRIVTTRPGGGPIDNLAEALLAKEPGYHDLEEEEQLIKKAITSTVLRSSSLGLVEAIKQIKRRPGENILLLIDQFEELFRYQKVEEELSNLNESSAFVNLLLEAVYQVDVPVYVALTMRSDFIGNCAQFPELTQLINDSHYLIPQMTRDQKRLAIEGPVKVGGGQIAPRLSQQLLNDVGDNPDQLPILQHALMRTWQYWVDNHEFGEPMDLRHYNAIGTLKEALSQHADEAFDGLNKREQHICEIMFKALTEKGAENSGIRRPTPLSVIASLAGVSEDEAIKVINKFREPGRTLLMPPYHVPLQSDSVIDISHESLMRIWSRLKAWVDEEAKSSEMYLKLSEAAERYQLGKAGLWKMPDLQLAMNWKEESKPTLVWGQRYHPAFERTMVFLDTSWKAYETEQKNKELLQKRALRRSRIAALFLGAAALVSIFFVILARTQQLEAEKQTVRAIENQRQALDNELAAKRSEEQAEIEKKSAQAAEERAKENARIAEIERNRAELSAEEARKQTDIAEREKQEALRQEKIANQQKQIAIDQSKIAEDKSLEATQQANRANRLRYLSISQSMAIKSLQVVEPERRGLIALQAYKFNEEYVGSPFNGDVYNGVFKALKELKGDSLNHYKGHTEAIRSTVVSQDGKYLYTAGSDGELFQWRMGESLGEPKKIIREEIANRQLAINDKHLILSTDNQEVLLFDLKQLEKSPQRIKTSSLIYGLVADTNGFYVSLADGTVKFHDGKDWKVLQEPGEKVRSLALSKDGKRLAGGTEKGAIFLWDLKKGGEKKKMYLKAEIPISAVQFNQKGNILAWGDFKGNITLYDLEKEQRQASLVGHRARISKLEFSPDNEILVSSSFDHSARLWPMDRLNDLPVVLDDHGFWVSSVSFEPGGKRLFTASHDGILRNWEVYPAAYANELCGFMNRNLSQREWNQYVGDDIPYEFTCDGLPKEEDEEL